MCKNNGYGTPMTPVTPMWASQSSGASRRSRLLPSAIEMTTPPQSIQRKLLNGSEESTQNTNQSHIAPSQQTQAVNGFQRNESMLRADVVDATMPFMQSGFTYDHANSGSESANVEATMGDLSANSAAESSAWREPRKSTPGRVVKQRKITPRKHSIPTVPYIQFPREQAANTDVINSSSPGHAHLQEYHSSPLTAPRIPIQTTATHVQNMVGTENKVHSEKYSAYNNYILKQATEDKSKVVWSPEVEMAFMEALWLIPCDSRKILVEQRGRGRNELIADYLQIKLNAHRTRKQVSSHLQVLKKLLANDQEFLDIVGPKRNPDDPKSMESNSRLIKPQTEGDTTIYELIEKLRDAKKNMPKPEFLLQAEANLRESLAQRRSIPVQTVEESKHQYQTASYYQQRLQQQQQQQHQHQHQHQHRQILQHHEQLRLQQRQQQQQQQQQSATSTHPAQVRFAHVAPIVGHPSQQMLTHLQEEPPLLHPTPVHVQDVDVRNRDQHISVQPSASVPPQDLFVSSASPRRAHSRHRRTTSRSVDIRGDELLPVQFIMTRKISEEELSNSLTYTRLIYAAFTSPTHELPFESMVVKFPELEKLRVDQQLNGVKIVHATAALYVKPANGPYASDVQFAIASDQPNPLQHRYMVRTVISSRGKDLLRCEMPCMFQAMTGRPFEQDKELINVPFLSDFWSDFLARLNDSSPEYTQAALSALSMLQVVYRVDFNGEKVCFVGLYEFSSAPDEFSARTQFRKVRGVSKSSQLSILSDARDITPPQFKPESFSPDSKHCTKVESMDSTGDMTNETLLKEPTTPTRSGNGSNTQLALGEQTPRPLSTPSMFGLGTPGLSALLNYESPAIFASPRRMNHMDQLDLNAFNYTNLNSESRGSPRSSKFEIQRAMTAFEPSGWDEMQDWIYK